MVAINKTNREFLFARLTPDNSHPDLIGWGCCISHNSVFSTMRFIAVRNIKTEIVANVPIGWNGKVNRLREAAKQLGVAKHELTKFLQGLIAPPEKPPENATVESKDFPQHILTSPYALSRRSGKIQDDVFVIREGCVVGSFPISQDGTANRRALESTCQTHGINFALAWDVIQRHRARAA